MGRIVFDFFRILERGFRRYLRIERVLAESKFSFFRGWDIRFLGGNFRFW